jgi:hypothetical protein
LAAKEGRQGGQINQAIIIIVSRKVKTGPQENYGTADTVSAPAARLAVVTYYGIPGPLNDQVGELIFSSYLLVFLYPAPARRSPGLYTFQVIALCLLASDDT